MKLVSISFDFLLALFVLLIVRLPFTLPRMHERCFFAADVISILYAFYSPRRFVVPIIVGAASLLSYLPFLFNEERIGLEYLATLMGVALMVAATDLLTSLHPDFVKRLVTQ